LLYTSRVVREAKRHRCSSVMRGRAVAPVSGRRPCCAPGVKRASFLHKSTRGCRRYRPVICCCYRRVTPGGGRRVGPRRQERNQMSHYRSNLRDIEFNLFEVFAETSALGRGPFAEIDEETARSVLAEVDRLSRVAF